MAQGSLRIVFLCDLCGPRVEIISEITA